jgi:hypothetical protein
MVGGHPFSSCKVGKNGRSASPGHATDLLDGQSERGLALNRAPRAIYGPLAQRQRVSVTSRRLKVRILRGSPARSFKGTGVACRRPGIRHPWMSRTKRP